jgi:hypothetical protein
VSAHPGEGTDVPEDIDTHTTAGKLADLDRRLDEAVHAGSAKAVEKQHAKGRKTASGSSCSSTRARSSSSTNWPGTARRRSGSRSGAPTAMA